jgi:hypothetical protein
MKQERLKEITPRMIYFCFFIDVCSARSSAFPNGASVTSQQKSFIDLKYVIQHARKHASKCMMHHIHVNTGWVASGATSEFKWTKTGRNHDMPAPGVRLVPDLLFFFMPD